MNVVYDQSNPNSERIMARIAEIGGKFYPYVFNLDRAQITVKHSSEFARHSEQGVMAICAGFENITDAINELPEWGRPILLRAGFYLTKSQVAEQKRTIHQAVQQWIDKGHLKSTQVPGVGHLIHIDDFIEFNKPAVGRPRTAG